MVKTMQELLEDIRNSYRPRIVDAKLLKRLSVFGGVLITGPRSCGKSWTGLYHSKSAIMLGDKETNRVAELNPRYALEGEAPRTVDEWQDVSLLWDIAKRNIDLENRKGMYIFTGSSVPPLENTRHSGINRIARMRMRTMSLFESGDGSGAVSLSDMFDRGRTDAVNSKMDYMNAIEFICRGGWPSAIGSDASDAADIPREYINSIAETDISKVDKKRRSASTAMLVMRSLARNSATASNIPLITADIRATGGNISEQTVRDYIDALKKLFVIEEQDGWNPSLRSRTQIRTSPKRHFTDPSLAAAVLNAGPDILAKDVRTAGFLFESLCYRDLSVYASASDGQVFHYRDNSDLEVDAVVQLKDGRWGAIEVKLGVSEFDKAASNLIRMKNKMMNAGAEAPSFLMILNATGGVAHTRPDGVTEVPVDCLGP